MTKKLAIPRGTSDILPSEISLWQSIECKARALLKAYNYKEIRTPVFEDSSLFKRSLGQTSEVVNKQLLELAGDKKEGFALRPEGTAPIVRSYIENSIDKKESITKVYYIGPMFRGERPQKGRLRQFNQIGVEALGPATRNPYLDAELIALSVAVLKDFGLNNFQLKLNTLGSLKDKENLAKELRKALKPQLSKLSKDDQDRYKRNVFRILDSKDEKTINVVKGLNLGYDHLSEQSKEYFGQVKGALGQLGIDYLEEPTLVRGLDYYTDTVFEIIDPSLGSQDALGAGGRYNNLVSDLGGPEVDAIGFALGIERIILAMPEEAKSTGQDLDLFVIALDEKAFPASFTFLDHLRNNGLNCDISYQITSMKSQMRAANKSQANFVAIIGEDELKRKVVALKNMDSGDQQEISIDDIDNISKVISS